MVESSLRIQAGGLAGVGRDAKVKIDFDDEAVGRKTLVVAVARLARGED